MFFSSQYEMGYILKSKANAQNFQVSNNLAYYLVLAEDRVDGVNECGRGWGGQMAERFEIFAEGLTVQEEK